MDSTITFLIIFWLAVIIILTIVYIMDDGAFKEPEQSGSMFFTAEQEVELQKTITRALRNWKRLDEAIKRNVKKK